MLKAGLRYELAPGKRLAFSNNQLAIAGGVLNPAGVVERNFKDIWSAGVAFVGLINKTRGYAVGFSYDSSPVSNRDCTIDLPFDETYKLSTAYAWNGSKQFDFALGATLMYFGEGKVDQTAQGVRSHGRTLYSAFRILRREFSRLCQHGMDVNLAAVDKPVSGAR